MLARRIMVISHSAFISRLTLYMYRIKKEKRIYILYRYAYARMPRQSGTSQTLTLWRNNLLLMLNAAYVATTLIILYNVPRVNRHAGFYGAACTACKQGEPRGGWKVAVESCSRPSSTITHTCRGHYASLKRPDRPYYVRGGPPSRDPSGERARAPAASRTSPGSEYNFRQARR